MIPLARFRILDPLLDGVIRGDPWSIAILVALMLLIVGLGQYNRWRRRNRDDNDD
jgi:hypothetical protein